MILVTRRNGPSLAINADLIERAEAGPDTVVTLVDGTRYVIEESIEELVDRIRLHRAAILARASEIEQGGGAPTPAKRNFRILPGSGE